MTTVAPFSEQALQQRTLAVDNAIAQQEFEGLTVLAEAAEHIRCADRGEITSEQVIQHIHARLKTASMLKHSSTQQMAINGESNG